MARGFTAAMDTAPITAMVMAEWATPITAGITVVTGAGTAGIMAVADGGAAALAAVASMVALADAVSPFATSGILYMFRKMIALLMTTLILGCTSVPSGPSALALPGDKASESQFRKDEKACRTYAHEELLSCSHKPQSLEEAQLHFDINYLQCMYTKGHLIPISGEILTDKTGSGPTPPPEKSPSR